MLSASGAMALFVVMIGASLIGLFLAPQMVERSLFRPYAFLRRQEYSTAITSGFVHADLAHLAFNAITYWFFAFPLELQIGTAKFLILYFAGLLLSHVGTFLKHRDNPEYATLGASGAIMAVLFASIVYNPGQSLFLLGIPFAIPAPLYAVGYLAYTYWSARHPTGRINHDAHLGGALTGLAFVALLDPQAYGRVFALFAG